MITVYQPEVSACVFEDDSGHRYVCGRKDMDVLKLWERYGHGAEKAGHANFDCAWGCRYEKAGYYAFCHADCYSPPVAVVRADDAGHAVDIFVDQFPWARIDAADLEVEGVEDQEQDKELKDNLSMSEDGHYYDPELIHLRAVKLVLMEID